MCSNAVPFASDAELCSDLDIQDINGQSQIVSKSRFSSLPGQPAVSLAKPVVLDFLQREMMTPDLNRMAPHMWLIAKPSSDHCSALHEQIVRNRNIVITENPELHLCWIDHKIPI
ncbi:hypothetical protein V496_00710 [Pseudogymnoascus sp. VKM F-4515 (FW-2607)]|nr:hypothetical protein V496_00710 [Pseudogymnoascus sp. VKM F-4515 (FW-2607)]